MKTLLSVIALTFVAAGLVSADPVNKKCPVSGKDVDATITVKHKDKDVAFCCTKCKAKFEADPAKYESKIK